MTICEKSSQKIVDILFKLNLYMPVKNGLVRGRITIYCVSEIMFLISFPYRDHSQ